MYSLDTLFQRRFTRLAKNSESFRNVNLQYTLVKYDGASISITYENGKLLRAVTRGDGFAMMLAAISNN
jgi:DNA ligase (NAD+)